MAELRREDVRRIVRNIRDHRYALNDEEIGLVSRLGEIQKSRGIVRHVRNFKKHDVKLQEESNVGGYSKKRKKSK